MTRTQSKVVKTSIRTTSDDQVAALVEAYTAANREHLERALAEQDELERDISFAFMVTSCGPAR